MSGWSAADLLPGLYTALLGAGLALLLRRFFDPVPWRVLAVFGLLVAVLFPVVLFGGGVLLPLGSLPYFHPYKQLPHAETPSIAIHGDLIHQIAPWALEVRRALWDGRWPLWNARAGAGMPLAADPQSQAFQPLVAAAYPFPIWEALGITAALKVLVALVFTFLLLRRQGAGEPAALAGSLAYGLGGFLLHWLGWPMANCAALLPPVLYALVRCDEEDGARDLALLFLATAALLLSGHPEVLVYSAAFAGLFLLDRVRRRERGGGRLRLLLRAGGAMALAGALAAPVLLPALDYLPKTERATLVDYHLAPASLGELWRELLKPETLELWKQRAAFRLLPVAAPRAFGDHHTYWGEGNVIDDAAGFAGTAALLAAAVAVLPWPRSPRRPRRFPQERLFAATLLASLLLIAQPPGLDRVLGQLPVFGATFIHQGHRLLLLVVLCTAALAAFEVERRSRGEGSRWTVLAAAAALAALVAWTYLAHPHPQNPEILAPFRRGLLALHLSTLALAAALLAAGPKGRWGRTLPWLFAGLVAAELLAVHRPSLPPAPRRLAYPVTPPLRFLQQRLGDHRLLALGASVLPANYPLVYGLNDVRIDNPSLPAPYAQVTWPLRNRRTRLFARPGHPLYDLLGVRYVLTRPGGSTPFPRVFQHPSGWIFERPDPLPRLFLPTRAVAFRGGSWVDWLEANPDFARRALVERTWGMKKTWRARQPRKSSLAVEIPEAEHLRARLRLAETRLLASSVYQDGHWHLLANGERQLPLLANGPFVAAWLPPETTRVDLLYRPRIFVAGCALAALALALAAAWWGLPALTSTGAKGQQGQQGPQRRQGPRGEDSRHAGHRSIPSAAAVTCVPASPRAMRTRSARAPMAAVLPVRATKSLAASTLGPIEPPAKA